MTVSGIAKPVLSEEVAAAIAAGGPVVAPIKAKRRDVTGAGDVMIAESESTVLPGLSANVLEAAAKPRGRGRK